MKKFVLQLANNSIRLFSTTNILRESSRPVRTRQYIENFYRQSHDPIWRLVDILQTSGGRSEVTEALQKTNISIQEFGHWVPVISQHDIASAVLKLQEIGGSSTSPGIHRQDTDVGSPPAIPIPSWVVLYLVGFKVRTPAHAKGPLLDILYGHLHKAPTSIQGPLLILALSHLARFNILIPIRHIVDTFLNTTLLDPHRQFNLFLQTLSSIPYRSVDNANNVVAILKAMEARQLKLRSATYDALLNDRFVTLQLTKFLQARMVQEGFVPTASHLEAYLRVFANNGAIHDAQKYHEAIHSTPTPTGDDGDEPIHVSKNPQYRANTLLLGAHDDRASAFNFLRTLMEQKTPSAKEPLTPHPLPHRREVRFLHKPKSDIYDQTAALHVAAKDLTTSTHRLIRLFVKLTSRPTIATHTVLIRGLLFRKEFARAEISWSRLLKTGLSIDKEALTTGVQALTRNGKPHAAFLLLEKYALKPTDDDSSSETSILHPPVVINAISMNEFLVSLKRISRPDAVFKFWDYMGVLYGTEPNTQTLSILLQSARLACRMDDTISGALAQMGLINPFRRRKVYRPNQSREEAVDAILTVLGHPSRGGLRRYNSGIWKDQLPLEAARKIFLQALFGNDPDRRLLSVEPPANAMRASYDSDASSDSGIGLIPHISPKKYVFTPPPDLFTADGKSHYPQIVVANANCFNYITLLGVTGSGRAAEIPLVLAWMKELRIQPSDSTLAVALVFWAEVGVQAPLVEKWTGGPENNEYTKLVDWIRDWVGEKRLPHARMLYKWQGIVKKMRETGI
ncbi:hypothetical protein BYT27DRAFT_7247056 [Phlegmacium glaucopus]|nr:hypothetical protein BYT27DRAFT_7247056 [Phlegmacium glaucopus]